MKAPEAGVTLFTDSTADLDPSAVERLGVHVVPLRIRVGGADLSDRHDAHHLQRVHQGLGLRGEHPTTSRPSPAAFLAAYEDAAARGARHIISVHVSGVLSGTCDAATLAAREAPIPVTIVDSEAISWGLGLQVRAAAQSLRHGGTVAEAVNAMKWVRQRTTMLLYVHSLEHLRRGGRIGTAARWLGGALAIKPLLAVEHGAIVPMEKYRTTARALTALADTAAHAVTVADYPMQVRVLHTGNEGRAQDLVHMLKRAGVVADSLHPLGAVPAIHAGPGALGVVIGPGSTLPTRGYPQPGG